MRQLCHNTYGNKKTTKLTLKFNGKYKQEKKNKYILFNGCKLCNAEKIEILNIKKLESLNKRNEL